MSALADDRDSRAARPSLSRQLLPAVHGMLARPLSSYYLLLASTGILLLIGLTMVFSATSVAQYAAGKGVFGAVGNQAFYALLGLVAFWWCQRLPATTLRHLGKYILGVSIVLLVVLGFLWALLKIGMLHANPITDRYGLGPLKANLNWLYFGPIGLQPGEFAKLGVVLWASDVITRKGPALGHWRELARPLLPMTGLLFVLIGYNDLGTMLILLALIVGMLWTAGVRLRIFGALGVLGLSGVGLLIAAASGGAGSGAAGQQNYRFARLTSFLQPIQNCDPQHDPNCYQLIQARAAIFEGGWFGVGLGKGVLKWGYLPESDNDFIFAVIADELGVVGCAVVITLYAVLAYTGFRIARRSADPFRRLVATGITTWIVVQAVINIGGVVGLLPITGVPLPFISAGGSSLVVMMAAVGILASFARAEPDAARALNARPPAKWVRLLWAPLPPLPPQRRPESGKTPLAAGGERRR